MEWSKAQSGENLLRSTMSNEMPTNQCENSPVRSIFDVRAPLTRSAGRIKKRQSGKAKREKQRRKKRVEKTIFSYREISAAKKKKRGEYRPTSLLTSGHRSWRNVFILHPRFFPHFTFCFLFLGIFFVDEYQPPINITAHDEILDALFDGGEINSRVEIAYEDREWKITIHLVPNVSNFHQLLQIFHFPQLEG